MFQTLPNVHIHHNIHPAIYCINTLKIIACTLLLFFSIGLSLACTNDPHKTAVQLAQTYSAQDVRQFLVSEKYDGVRAIWKNGKLRTRTGNLIHAPSWFTKQLPNMWLDGELWRERGNFSYVFSTVSKHTPVDKEWMHIKYMVFDAPNDTAPFSERAKHYTEVLKALNLPHIKPVEQFSVNDNQALTKLLHTYTNKQAEGLMLHRANAMFSSGRNHNLLKLKLYNDAEAKVVGYTEGKGKYAGKVGALVLVFTHNNGDTVRFKIGSGLSDHEREYAPKIGTIITFRYHGFTPAGIPRFATYVRQRRGLND